MTASSKLTFTQDKQVRKALIRENRKRRPVNIVLAALIAAAFLWACLSAPYFLSSMGAGINVFPGAEYVLVFFLTILFGVLPLGCAMYLRVYVVDRKISNKYRETLTLDVNALTDKYEKKMDVKRANCIEWSMPYESISRIVYMPNLQAVCVYGRVLVKWALVNTYMRTDGDMELKGKAPFRVLHMYYQGGDAWLQELAARTGLTIEEDLTKTLPDEERI
ncbi:MAG: hypothetical protein IKT57_01045 [Clostridia bacterium]|nr:hypothetical protein [Clostridia bacterium]